MDVSAPPVRARRAAALDSKNNKKSALWFRLASSAFLVLSEGKICNFKSKLSTKK